MTAQSTQDRGFTLLEVLVALAIAALTMVLTASLAAFLARQVDRTRLAQSEALDLAATDVLLRQIFSGTFRQEHAVRLTTEDLTVTTLTPPLSLAAAEPVELNVTRRQASGGWQLILRLPSQAGDNPTRHGDTILVEDLTSIDMDLWLGTQWKRDNDLDGKNAQAVRFRLGFQDGSAHNLVIPITWNDPVRCIREVGTPGCG